MGRKHFGTNSRRNEPVPRNWSIFYHLGVCGLFLLPASEIDCAGKWCHHDKLRKCHSRLESEFDRSTEGTRFIRRKTEDERTQYVNTMLAKRLQLLDKSVT